MTTIDPERERARLAVKYAAMSDLELRKVGRDPMKLSDSGRDSFIEEMRRRGLAWSPEPIQAKPAEEEEILISLAEYADLYQARIDRDMLARLGIKTFFCIEDPVAADEDASVTSPIKLLVRPRGLAEARQQLKMRDEAELAFGVEKKDR